MKIQKEKGSYRILLVCLVTTISMAVFGALYLYNNKYTHKSANAIHGVLYVEDAYEKLPLYYLSREWEYYPDVLLSPKDSREGLYYRYLSIGEYGGMELGDKNRPPHGSGTYRLLLALPEKEHTYSLYLPEIFSAYRLYIDGKLAGQMGNPDPENYKESIQNRNFSFAGKGNVEVLLAVTDKTSSYSGMPYIPVFGSTYKINTERGIALFLDNVVVIVGILVLLFSLYAFWKTRIRETGLFAVVCICVIGYTAYPMLHTYLPLSVRPWYALETLGYFLMLPVLLFLAQNILAGREKKRSSWLMIGITGFFALAAFIGELVFSAFAWTKAMYILSDVSDAIKWLTAAYLIVTAFQAADSGKHRIILTGALVYGCALAADRIWPLYEPIYGGWFPELGGVLLMVSFAVVLCEDVTEAYSFRLTYEEQTRQMEKRLLMQEEHYEELSRNMDEIRRMRHDMRQHMRVAMEYLGEQKYTELKEYLTEFAAENQKMDKERLSYCKNQVVDAVIHYYAAQIEKTGAEFVCKMNLTEELEIQDTDIGRIFGNLLENALKAVGQQRDTGERYVRCQCKTENDMLFIRIRNTCDGKLRQKNGRFYSTSHEGRGVGISSVEEAVKKYGGFTDFEAEGNTFMANVIVPLLPLNK